MRRRRRIASASIVLTVAIGCRQLLGIEPAIDNPPVDADLPPPDAGPCQAIGLECIGFTLRTCTTLGQIPTDTRCSLGCVDMPDPHCGQLIPGGGAVVPEMLVDTMGLVPKTMELSVSATGGTINTDNGSITNARPAGNGVVNGIDFQIINGVAVFRFADLRLDGSFVVRGANPIAIVSTKSIDMDATLDLRGTCLATAAGPGGFGGGGVNANGISGGKAGTGNAAGASGGGGGGHGGLGGAGGAAGALVGGAGGPSISDPQITKLAGGGGGGGGGATGGTGGGGGGAIQLVANDAITIRRAINVGGCGGAGGTNGGGGGGAAGAILVEGARVELTSGAILAGNGGGGGAGGGGGDGADGSTLAIPAPGGTGGQTAGGLGGAGLAPNGTAGGAGSNGAGGGGGVGRIRINTLSGSATTFVGAIVSPPASQSQANVR